MINCVYTSQKQRKIRTWQDGYVTIVGGKFSLYDADRTLLYSSTTTVVDNEIETPKYLVFIENFDDSASLESEQPAPEEGTRNKKLKKSTAAEDAPHGRTGEEILDLFK
jgi:hypothetical protein